VSRIADTIPFRLVECDVEESCDSPPLILATETHDEAERNRLMAEILKYNEEDLGATWAVFDWLRKK
jgi:predicted RecB family nuclease